MLSFRELNPSDAQKLLDWRTSDRISTSMKTEVEYNIKKQKIWLNSIFNDESYYAWMIQFDRVDVGLLYIHNLDLKNKKTNWGFYLGDESVLGKGIGKTIPPCLYKFLFETFHLNTVFTEVLYDNLAVIKLHLSQGAKFQPRESYVIEKGGKESLIICLSLDRKRFEMMDFRFDCETLPTFKWKANPLRDARNASTI